jgi:TonB-dependent SusC/RagA subfamily outer membrane receptor
MSPSRHPVSLSEVARLLVCAHVLVALGACQRTSSAARGPSRAQPAIVASGQQSNNELRPRGFPGVDLVRTRTGGFVVQVHSGLVGTGEPLYVVDGAPVTVERSRGIDWVKLDDVVQIRVLKDPSEIAVYGGRAVNGVIVITTRLAAAQGRRRR